MASRRSFNRTYTDEVEMTDRESPNNEGVTYNNEKGPSETRKESVQFEALIDIAEKIGDDEHGTAPIDDLYHVKDQFDALTAEESRAILVELLEEHKYDYNLSDTQRQKTQDLIDGPMEGQEATWSYLIRAEAAICKYYSPYPEVRSVATPHDDPDMPCETIRAHFLGYAWACIGQFINSLFISRFPSIGISSSVIQILMYPCGVALSYILPDWGFHMGGVRYSLNPGPWTYKEQMLATIIVDVGLGTAYVFYNIQTEQIFYKDRWLTPGYEILLLLSTQLMGLGFAGLLRRFVIYPVQTIWPSILPTIALNKALLQREKKETIHGWSMSRYRCFLIFFVAMFFYYWLPGYVFGALSTFNWITWIAPNNFKLALVTGSQLGMGFNPIPTFDWNYMNYYYAPLAWPFFATVQQYVGQVIGCLAVLALYFTNTKWSAYLPPNTSHIYDNTGARYNIKKVLTADNQLDIDEYKAYSPAFYCAGNLVLYSCFFLFYPLSFCFILLDQWRSLGKAYRQVFSAAGAQAKRSVTSMGACFKALGSGQFGEAAKHLYHVVEDPTSVYEGFDDPFTNAARAYPEVPDWWFFMITLVAFIFAIIILTVFPIAIPVWTIFFVLGLNIVFLVPMSYLYAISGTTEGLNVVSELVVGYALPGKPEAMMFVKAYGYNINGQADNYISDQKMGFYTKVPPRAMYRGQIMSAIITCFVCYGVINFVDNIPGVCTEDPSIPHFNCLASSAVFFSASVVWGLIGPARIFGQIYPIMKYAFLIGFLLALVWWGVKRYGSYVREAFRSALPSAIFNPINMVIFTPISWLYHVHPALVINGMLALAPGNLSYGTGSLYLSFFFMYYIRRNKTAWFEKYNYVIAAALTAGVALSAIIIFFAVQYKDTNLSWWGNNVPYVGTDAYAGQTALLTELPARGYFGPDSWY